LTPPYPNLGATASAQGRQALPPPTYRRTLWPSTAGQLRGRAARHRPTRLARALLPLGVILLIAAGSVLGPGGGLPERRTPLAALAPLTMGSRLSATPEPQPASDRALEAEADPTADAIPPDPVVPVAREATDRREHLVPEPKKQAELSPHETPPSTARAKHLMATALLSNPLSHEAASATPRETLQRPPQPPGKTRLARTPRMQSHRPSQPLARRGSAAPPAMPTGSEPVAHDTPDATERSAASPQREAQLFQNDTPLAAAPSTPGATDTQLPLPPPTQVPEGSAVPPRSPEPPPREAARPAPRVPSAAWEMTRPVPARPLQGHTVEIHTGLAHASVLINGKYIGQTPVVIHLPLGVYTMAIDNPGYAQMTWKMHVDPDGVALHMTRQRGWSWAPPYAPRVLAY
jgi:hypothetical protein